MQVYKDVYYTSPDGLTLYARDYPGPSDAALTVLCMHGLTRNSRDFIGLAEHLSKRYRVLVPDQRGRGLSDYDPNPMAYHPGTYVVDMAALLMQCGVMRPALIGTSMGGLMAMIMTATNPLAVAGVVINDIGPVIDNRGIERIKSYVGKLPEPTTWAEAEQQTRLLNSDIFPDFTDTDWHEFTHALYREKTEAGKPVLDYDPAIAVGLAAGSAVPVDLWPLFEALKAVPTLAIRGALSDLLSVEIFEEMQQRHPLLQAVTVPARGHAPLLTEPTAIAAIDVFLTNLV